MDCGQFKTKNKHADIKVKGKKSYKRNEEFVTKMK